MAAQSVKTYAMMIWGAQKVIARKLGGVEIKRLDITSRVVLVTVDLVLAMIIQALVNANILTDAAIQARIDAVSGVAYSKLPDTVPPDDEDQGTVAPDPDIGG